MSNNAPPFDATLLLTRPEDDSRRVVQELTRRLGAQPAHLISPLIEIQPTPVDIDPVGDVALTSAHGARRAAQLGFSGRAWCVGSHTAQVAADLGFQSIAADGTGAALVDLIRRHRAPGSALTHVRGEHRSFDVAGSLAQGSIACRDVIAYRQLSRPLSAAAMRLFEGAAPVIVPLFSPRTARIFWDNHPKINDSDYIIAISEAAAAGAHGRVVIAAYPGFNAMCDLIAPLLHAGGSVDRAGSD